MAKQTQNSPLNNAHGNKLESLFQKHANETTTAGFDDLPPGIKGVAQLSSVQLLTVKEGDNKGEHMLRMEAVILTPETFDDESGNTHEIYGRTTKYMEMLCDTKKGDGSVYTADEHVNRAFKNLRSLFGQDCTQGITSEQAFKEFLNFWHSYVTTPEEDRDENYRPIYFNFSTSAGKVQQQGQTPRTFENWNGTKGLENFVPPQRGMRDETGDHAEAGEEVEPTAPPMPVKKAANVPPAPNAGKVSSVQKTTPQPARQSEQEDDGEGETFDEFGDLNALVAKAENQRKTQDTLNAQKKLEDWAVERGWDRDAVENATDWKEVADMIRTGPTGETQDEEERGEESRNEGRSEEEEVGQEEEQEEEKVIEPKLNSIVHYKVRNGNKVAAKASECKVQSVDKKKGTCSLKNLDNGASHHMVPWAELI